MAANAKTKGTVQEAHARIRAEAIAHFADQPHGANDRLEWIKKGMCDFRGIPYVPPEPPPPPVTVEVQPDGISPLGVLTSMPDDGTEGDEF